MNNATSGNLKALDVLTLALAGPTDIGTPPAQGAQAGAPAANKAAANQAKELPRAMPAYKPAA
jgi:hypothetical protein